MDRTKPTVRKAEGVGAVRSEHAIAKATEAFGRAFRNGLPPRWAELAAPRAGRSATAAITCGRRLASEEPKMHLPARELV